MILENTTKGNFPSFLGKPGSMINREVSREYLKTWWILKTDNIVTVKFSSMKNKVMHSENRKKKNQNTLLLLKTSSVWKTSGAY